MLKVEILRCLMFNLATPYIKRWGSNVALRGRTKSDLKMGEGGKLDVKKWGGIRF